MGRQFTDIPGDSNYVGVGVDGSILDLPVDVGMSVVWTTVPIGFCAALEFGPSYGFPISLSGGWDYTEQIWSTTIYDETEDQEEIAFNVEDDGFCIEDILHYDYTYHIIAALMIIGAVICMKMKMGNTSGAKNEYKSISEENEITPLLY